MRSEKTIRRTVSALTAVLFAGALLLAFPFAAHADEANDAAGSAAPALRASGTIYVNGTALDDVISGIPEGESRTIYVKTGTYSGFTINKDIDITLIPDGGSVVFNIGVAFEEGQARTTWIQKKSIRVSSF